MRCLHGTVIVWKGLTAICTAKRNWLSALVVPLNGYKAFEHPTTCTSLHFNVSDGAPEGVHHRLPFSYLTLSFIKLYYLAQSLVMLWSRSPDFVPFLRQSTPSTSPNNRPTRQLWSEALFPIHSFQTYFDQHMQAITGHKWLAFLNPCSWGLRGKSRCRYPLIRHESRSLSNQMTFLQTENLCW